jgi:hypothetical protein
MIATLRTSDDINQRIAAHVAFSAAYCTHAHDYRVLVFNGAGDVVTCANGSGSPTIPWTIAADEFASFFASRGDRVVVIPPREPKYV